MSIIKRLLAVVSVVALIAGVGAFATPAQAATPPSTPQNLVATPGDGSATFAWDPPANDGGDPSITYYWTLYNSLFAPVSDGNTTGTSINVSGLTNGETYNFDVFAQNSAGYLYAVTTTVTPAAPVVVTTPSAPQNDSVTPGNGSLRFSWTAPANDGGAPITAYGWYYVEGGLSGPLVGGGIESGSTTSVDITGLNNGIVYCAFVRAENSAGFGDWTLGTCGTPVAPTAPAAITDLAGTGGNGSVDLTWTAPADGGSPITGYNIYSRNIGGGIPPYTLIGSTSGATTYTATGLTNYDPYQFYVVAVNAVGNSAASNLITVSPAPTDPSEPQNVIVTAGDATLSFSWDAPANDGGSSISGYEWSVYKDSVLDRTGTTSSTSYNYGAATNGSNYCVSITAVNGVGFSSPTSDVCATPASSVTAPSVPQNVTVVEGDTQLTFNWDAPASDGGDPSVTYDYLLFDGSMNPVGGIGSTTSLSHTFTGLTNGQAYTMRLFARNAAGGSAYVYGTGTPQVVPVYTYGVSIDPAGPVYDGDFVDITVNITSDNPGTIGFVLTNQTTGDQWMQPVTGNYTYTTSTTRYQLGDNTFVAELKDDSSNVLATSSPMILSVVAKTAPSVPQNLSVTASDATLDFAWDAPADNGGDASITYEYALYDGGMSLVTSGSTTSTGQSFYGLTNGATYTFQLQARNSIGASSQVSIAGTPVAPVVPVYTSTLTTDATATMIEGTEVTASATGSRTPVGIYTVELLIDSAVVVTGTGYDPEAIHTFIPTVGAHTLQARTLNDEGDVQAISAITTFEVTAKPSGGGSTPPSEEPFVPSVPSKVLNLKFTVDEATNMATVTWDNPAWNGGSNLGLFDVKVTDGLTASANVLMPTYSFSVEAGKVYVVTVAATNSVGTGEATSLAFSMPEDENGEAAEPTVDATSMTAWQRNKGANKRTGLKVRVAGAFPSCTVTGIASPGGSTVTGVSAADGTATLKFTELRAGRYTIVVSSTCAGSTDIRVARAKVTVRIVQEVVRT